MRVPAVCLLMTTQLLASACVAPADIEEIKKDQKKILEKLDELSKRAPAPRAPTAQAQPGRPDPAAVYAFDAGNSPVKGKPDAWVTIIEVSDFQCPFCARVVPTLKQVTDKFGDEVRIVFKHNPLSFHQRALPAAVAAECAGEQEKFWQMHDQLFENQRQLEDADLEKHAAAVGVDMGAWKSCVASQKPKDRILEAQKTAMALGARGTPAFFINGRFLSGAQPFPAFEQLVQEELNKAKASGLAKGEYYAKAVIAKGKKTL